MKRLTLFTLALFSLASLATENTQNPWLSNEEKLECVFRGKLASGEWVPLSVGGLGDGMHDHIDHPNAPYVPGDRFGSEESDLSQGLASATFLVDPSSPETSGSLHFRLAFNGKRLGLVVSKYDPQAEDYVVLKKSSASLRKFKKLGRRLSVSASTDGLELWNGSISIVKARAVCRVASLDL